MLLVSDKELKAFVSEAITEAQKVLPLDSLEDKSVLNPDIFDQEENMRKDVKLALLRIARHFFDYIDRDIELRDVVLTGSLANYNWSDYSDIDIHLIAELGGEKDPDAMQELLVLRSKAYNEKHDIEVKGYEVEVFVESDQVESFTSGVYSLKNDKWLIKPQKKYQQPLDRGKLKRKATMFMNKIDRAAKNKDVDELENIKQMIKGYRSESLRLYGEKGTGNLVFKLLRRTGYLGKLYDKINSLEDKELSLENEF